ncbi:MAG: NADH-quinone oxidoreductase subunit NuoE [Bacteroidia bacterium]|nr:NADH-quinone oxidoreductase subunit NuoE [Bacteroidia bacterium]MBP9688612.1 NADH-quinone oxidoreductase subunit NuoE [Bacteroidia bacterium]
MSELKDVRFSAESETLIKSLMNRYPEGKHKSALLPALHIAQAEFDGWLSAPVMDKVAELLNIQPIEVYEVASFYSMFNLKPVGKCLIEVCQTSSCWLRGANDVVAHIEKRLGIKNGETTTDGKFTLKTVECLGSCGTAPMIQIGEQYHENLTLEKVDELINQHKNDTTCSKYLTETTFRKN